MTVLLRNSIMLIFFFLANSLLFSSQSKTFYWTKQLIGKTLNQKVEVAQKLYDKAKKEFLAQELTILKKIRKEINKDITKSPQASDYYLVRVDMLYYDTVTASVKNITLKKLIHKNTERTFLSRCYKTYTWLLYDLRFKRKKTGITISGSSADNNAVNPWKNIDEDMARQTSGFYTYSDLVSPIQGGKQGLTIPTNGDLTIIQPLQGRSIELRNYNKPKPTDVIFFDLNRSYISIYSK